MSVKPEEFPPAPFELSPGITICDTALWLRKLREDLGGPREKHGALQIEIERAYQIWNLEDTRRLREQAF